MIARWLEYLVESVLVLKEDQGNDSDSSCEGRRRLDREIQMLHTLHINCRSEVLDLGTANCKYRSPDGKLLLFGHEEIWSFVTCMTISSIPHLQLSPTP